MNFETLKYTVEHGVAEVALNRPPVNAINLKMIDELGSAFDAIAADRSVKAVVLACEGANFAAGADIKEIARQEAGAGVAEFSRRGNASFFKIENLRKPVIAAIRGFCLGGGCELAMSAHVRIADHSAIFGQPEIKLGISPGFAATQRLPRLVGMPAAIRLLLSGEQIDADAAFRLGLVQEIVPAGKNVEKAAMSLAKTIAGYGLKAIEGIMEATLAGGAMPIADGAALETKIFGELSRTKDMREGFAAFIEKRKPNFTDE